MHAKNPSLSATYTTTAGCLCELKRNLKAKSLRWADALASLCPSLCSLSVPSGCVMYQMLLGVTPLTQIVNSGLVVESRDVVQLVHCVLTQVPPAPSVVRPSIPQILSDIVMKCLEKDVDRRYQSAFGLSVDLRSAMQLTQALAAPEGGSLNVPSLKLGVWDQAAVFSVSKKLYGREPAVRTLERSLSRMLQTRRPHVVCVRGSPGSG
jgi:histidine kinase